MLKSLRNFQGKEAIFIDANIFLHHAFDVNHASVEFLKKVESSDLKVYTSALVIEEITFMLMIQSASNFLEKVTLNSVKIYLKDDENREKVFKPVEEYREYINYLKDFGLTILDLTDRDMVVAIQKARTYGLITADAAHIAIMERKGITHIASSDSDFKAISSITLWSPD